MSFDGKKEIKICLVMDDYKLKNKDDYWIKALKTQPIILRDYEFVREKITAGITKDTVICIRYFKLKENL